MEVTGPPVVGPLQEGQSARRRRRTYGGLPGGATPPKPFVLFLDHLDEGGCPRDVRGIPLKATAPGKHAAGRGFLFQLYMHKGLPPKAQLARRVDDFNKGAPADIRLGSGSTSEINLLKYIGRMLDKGKRRRRSCVVQKADEAQWRGDQAPPSAALTKQRSRRRFMPSDGRSPTKHDIFPGKCRDRL